MTDAPHTHPLHPFSLDLDLLDRMLNFEIAGDPHYTGLEVQGFDDAVHGRGVLVFLSRRSDGKIDVYFEPGLRLDRANYGVGNGIGEWRETEFEVARLDVDDRGVAMDVRFRDVSGRVIDVTAGDETPKGRRMAAFLAPMGAAVSEPRSLPLIWMSHFDLLRRSGAAPRIQIDGREASPGRLPAERLLGRRLIKVAADLCIAAVNPAHMEPVPLGALDVGGETIAAPPGGVRAVVGHGGGHEVRLSFAPAFPDLGELAGVASTDGTWAIEIDRLPVVAGDWSVRPGKEDVVVRLDVTNGWRPKGLPLLMSLVTRVEPVFRTWPTTYRWTATIADVDKPTMTSRWERIGNERGESYRSFTKSG